MASDWRLEPFVGPADTFNPSRQPVHFASDDVGQRERKHVRALLRGYAAALEAFGTMTVHVTAYGVVNAQDGSSGDTLNFSAAAIPNQPQV